MKSSIHKLTKLTIDIYNKKVSLMPEEAKLFQLNTYSRLILLNIMKGHYSGKYLSAEEIIKNIHNIYGSRASIVKCLQKAYKLNLIEKDLSREDKRAKKIIPTKKLIKYFEDKITYFKKLNVSLNTKDANYFVL